MISKTKIRAIDAHAHSLRKDEDSYRIALAGTTHRNSLDLLESFSERDEIFIGYGLHPWFIDQHHYKYNQVKWDEFDFIGEIGLDRGKRGKDFSKQCLLFESMLDVAEDTQKSVCLHAVRSYGQIYQYLRRRSLSLYFHGYQGSEEFLSQFPDAFIGVGPQNLKHKKMEELYKNISLSQILFETDDEADLEKLWYVYRWFSERRNVSIQKLIESQENNFFRWIHHSK
jgi:Tat protein secretion system quality control protein TatD with DNase activity